MNIVFISDAEYAHPTGISIRSLLRHSSPEHIYVIDTGMSGVQVEQLTGLSEVLEIVPLPDWAQRWLEQFKMHGDSHVSRTTYAKLIMHRLIPEASRVVYLDGDVLVLQDISTLYARPLDGAMIGATCNFLTMLSEQERLKLPHKYFNAGVLLCPLDKWRSENVDDTFLNWYRDNYAVVRYDDQDIFNAVFAGRVSWIDKRWNVSQFEVLAMRRTVPFDLSQCRIIHFNGGHKPWNENFHQRWGLDADSIATAYRLLDGLTVAA